MNCPRCGQPLSQVGSAFHCVACDRDRSVKSPSKGGRPAEPLSPPPVRATPKEQVLKKDAITAGELRSWLKNATQNPATIRCSDGASEKRSPGLVAQDIQSLDDQSVVFRRDELYLLTTLRQQEGWICLEFEESRKFLVNAIRQHEQRESKSPTVVSAVRRFRELEAEGEGGATVDHFSSRLSSTWICVKDMEREIPNGKWILFLAKGVFQHLRTATDIWSQRGGPGYSFIGGGFGLQAAATGMAIGAGLNAIADKFANSKNAAIDEAGLAHWLVARIKLDTLDEACP